MTSTTPAKRICIDVQGAKEITLMVNCLDTIDWDVANWAGARFCVKGTLPLEQLTPISSDAEKTSYDISAFAATTFSADLSVDASAGDNEASFRIEADGETLLEETLTPADGVKHVTVNVKDVSIFSLITSGAATVEESWTNASIILDAIGYDKLITGVYADGKVLDGYAFYRGDYNMLLDSTVAPTLTVEHLPEAEVTVKQATGVPGTATVQVTYGKESWDFAVRFLRNSNEIYLSDMQWSSAEASYGEVQRDKTVEGKAIELNMDGNPRTFSKGVGFNATAQLDVNISGMGFKTFTTYVGVEPAAGTSGTINYKIYVDGYCAYESGTMDGTDDAQFVAINVEGASIVSLIADCMDDIIWDHGAWADAKFSEREYQFGAWSSEGNWLISNQEGFAAVAGGKVLEPLIYGNLLQDGIQISYDVEYYSTGDVPDDAGYEFYNASSGIRIGGRIKGVHNEVSIDLIYCLPDGTWKTVYESPRWVASGKNVHVQLSCEPGEETFKVTVTNETGTLIDQAVTFPGVTDENFYSYGDGLQFSFHNDNPSRFKVYNISFGSTDTTEQTVKPGDVNNDKEVDIFDIYAIRKHISGEALLSENGLKAADANFDNVIDSSDLAAIRDHIFGINVLPDMMFLFLNETSVSMKVGEQFTLTAGNAAGSVTWNTDNSAVATVEDGVVTAVGAGTAVITANDGVTTASCVVTIEDEFESITKYWTMPEGWADASQDETLAFTGSGSLSPNVYKESFKGNENLHIAFDVTHDPNSTDSSFYFTIKAPSQSEFLRFEFQWGPQSPSYLSNANVVLNRGANYGYAWQLISSTGLTWTGSTYHIEIDWDAATKQLTLTRSGDPSDTQTATITCEIPSAAGTAGENFFDSCSDEALQLEMNTWTGSFTISNFTLSNETEALPFTLSETAKTMKEGEQFTLTASNGAGDVYWSSGNAAVATVENGVVTAVGAGTAVITATDGVSSASCTVTVEAVNPKISQYWTMPEGWEDASEGEVLAFSGSGSLSPNIYKESFKGSENLHMAFDVTPDPNATESSFYFTIKAPSQSEFLRFEFQWGPQSPSHICNANVVLNRGADYGYAWQLINGTGWSWTGMTYHVEIDWDAATKKLTLTKSGDPADTQTASITCEIPSAAGTAGENFFDNCGEEELQLEMNTWAGGFTISNFELENTATQKTAKTKNASESDDELGVALNLSKATLIPGETIVATVDLENYDLFSETNGITDMQVEVLWNTDVVEYVDNSALCLNSVANGTTYQNAAYNSDKEKLVYLFYDTEDMPLNESTAGLCSFELRVNDQVADGASADFSVILKYVDSQGRQETVYTDITGSAQWSFHDKDPNWHYDENGDLYHFLNGEEATFLPAIDASKGFSISFDLWFDMSKCRTDFPTFTMKLVDTDSTDYFFSRIRISSYNKEWLVEPQFYNGSWQDLSFSDSWLKGWHGIDDTVHVELERPANSDQLIYTISSGDIQLATGNIYADAMADLLSGKLRLVVGLDYPGNDVVKLSEFSIISGDRQLFNPGSGGTALPEYDTFNGDTDTRGTNFSSGDIQYTLEQVLSTAPDTIEAWVKVLPNTSDGKIGAIFSNYEHDSYPNCTRLVTLEVGEGGKPNLVWSYDGTTQSYTANTDIRTGRWTHIAYTRDLNAGKVYCYIDGEKVGVWTIQTELKGEKAPSEIHSIGGSWLEGNPCYFLGSIADVRVYSACRSQEQILADMSDSASYEEETLLGAWSLEGERGTEDLSLYGNDIQLYEGEWISYTSEPGDYSFVVLPDTQNMLLQYPDNENSDYFEALIDWILENKEAENIQFVMHLGDVFNKTSNTHEQEVNQEILNRLYENLPWAFCLGNHDYDSYSPRDTTLVNQFYPLSSFRTMETFGGSYDETVDNTYHLLEVQGNKYLIMTLEFGPRDQVVQWANEVIAAHADYQVILMTHGYLMNNQEYLYDQCNAPSIYGVEGNDPDQLWDKLVSRHESIIMILSGHISDDEINYLPRAGVNGNIVWQVQMDMQNYDRDAGAGLLAMLRFRDGGKTIDVQYYSPYRDASYRIMNQISIDLNPETYTVSWNVEGNISSEEYTKGIMPVYRGVPEKISADPEVKYVFTGWDQELTPVLQDVTYTAQFKEVTTVAKTPGDFGWDTDETDGSKNFAGWTSTDGTDLTAVYSDTVGNHRVWKELLTNPKEFTLTATADVDEQSSVYLKVLGQTLELDGRNGDGDQVGVKLNGVFQEWVKATACTADISIRRIDGGSLLITVSGDETKTYTITPYDTGKNVEIGIYGGTMQLTNLVVKSVQEDDPGVTVSPQEFGWDNDSGDFSGWTATDEFNLSVVRADAACERVWKGLLTDLDNFTIDLDVTNDNTSSTYIKVLGVTVELDSNNGDGNETFMKVGGTNYDWLAGNGCKFHVTISRENGGDLTVTVTGAGNETPFTATASPTENNENVELGLYRGISRFENITVVSGEAEPTEVEVKISHTVSFDSDLQMNYRIKLADILAAVPNYVTEGACLVVEKDRYPIGGGEKTVETVTLYPDLSTDAERMLFNLAGIQSVEMGSELRAVLHFFDAEGNEYYTTVDTYSVLAYAELCFDYYNPATDGYLFTMLIDCMNYGAAAQVAFDRRANELVNAGLEAYQQYASTELSAELTDVRTYVDNDRAITAVTKMGFSVTFADKTEINAKLTIAEGYTKEDISSVKVLNENGEEVAVLTDFTELDDGRLQVTFTGVKSVNMRDMYYFVAYVGDQVASQNVGYSIEAYAKSSIASSDANAANLAKACIYYGDSAKVYFDSLTK